MQSNLRNKNFQTQRTVSNPSELFVGNLSFFCGERELYELFSTYGDVQSLRIVMNDDGTRSLLYGFVSMNSPQIAREVARLLNNHLFMGRSLKVELCDRKQQLLQQNANVSSAVVAMKSGYQVHVSFSSSFPSDQVILPSEILLRRYFMRYGSIIDVAVREYSFQDLHQEGYGFVTFDDPSAVLAATAVVGPQSVNGISMICTITHHQSGRNYSQPQYQPRMGGPMNMPFQQPNNMPNYGQSLRMWPADSYQNSPYPGKPSFESSHVPVGYETAESWDGGSSVDISATDSVRQLNSATSVKSWECGSDFTRRLSTSTKSSDSVAAAESLLNLPPY